MIVAGIDVPINKGTVMQATNIARMCWMERSAHCDFFWGTSCTSNTRSFFAVVFSIKLLLIRIKFFIRSLTRTHFYYYTTRKFACQAFTEKKPFAYDIKNGYRKEKQKKSGDSKCATHVREFYLRDAFYRFPRV